MLNTAAPTPEPFGSMADDGFYSKYYWYFRDGNLILTALAIGRVPLINATKSLGFVLAQAVLTLAWVSGRVLISNPQLIFPCLPEYRTYSNKRHCAYLIFRTLSVALIQGAALILEAFLDCHYWSLPELLNFFTNAVPTQLWSYSPFLQHCFWCKKISNAVLGCLVAVFQLCKIPHKTNKRYTGTQALTQGGTY